MAGLGVVEKNDEIFGGFRYRWRAAAAHEYSKQLRAAQEVLSAAA